MSYIAVFIAGAFVGALVLMVLAAVMVAGSEEQEKWRQQ